MYGHILCIPLARLIEQQQINSQQERGGVNGHVRKHDSRIVARSIGRPDCEEKVEVNMKECIMIGPIKKLCREMRVHKCP